MTTITRGKSGMSGTSLSELVEVYILAAGEGSRLGGQKATLPFGDGSIFRRITCAFRNAGLKKIRVIGRTTDESLAREANLLSVRYIFNLDPGQGMAGSVLEAIDDCRSRWAGLCPVDMPLLTSATIGTVLSGLSDDVACVQPECEGRPKHPVFLRASTFLSLRDHLRKGGTLREFLPTVERKLVACGAPHEFFDADTPEDYSRLLAIAGLGPTGLGYNPGSPAE